MKRIYIPDVACEILAAEVFVPKDSTSKFALACAEGALNAVAPLIVAPELRDLLPDTELAPAERNRWVYARLTARLTELDRMT